MARDEQPLLTDGDQLGGSIAVPNVQQLASESKDGQVPIRYIRPELELDQVSTDGSHQIPVINMAKLAGSGDAAAAEESAMLHSACKDWGFFQVINHSVTEEVMQRMKFDVEEFFKLPLQEKMSCAQLPNTIGLQGYGPSLVSSDEHKLSWGDMLFISTKPVSERDMRYWPRVPSSFRDSLDQYSSDLEKLVFTLLNYMAINLGLEPEKLLTLFKDGLQAVGINYYPPCAFIVNVGDMIEIMSNGEYKSIEHRAMVNPDKERISIATFHSPNMKAMIGPILELINEKEQAKYQSVSREEYMKLVLSSKLNGKGLISQLKIMQPATE
ncbi:S-norcoclaurine synthase 1 [Linum perenne]